jgi:phosphatidylserine/phosphatidylglycerophosphate/cardiolipin synthase-like enzyme
MYPDPEALVETARILGRTVPVEELDGVRASLEFLYYTDREVSPDALRDIAPCDLSASAVEDIVFQLAVEGIVDETRLDKVALREVFIGAKLVAAQETPPENTVVATIPYDDSELDPEMFAPLHGNLLELIRSANDRLVLMSPFLSKRAYERLRPALHTAADNGAAVTVVTRYLTYGDEDYNREFVRTIENDSLLASQTTSYEYIDDDTWTTFHAKIVIADGTQAYLGTANLTHRGLKDNLELGVIFEDKIAERISLLVQSLMNSPLLHRVVQDNSEFVRE